MTTGSSISHTDATGRETARILWQSCIEQLAQELPEQQFNTWIKPLSAQVTDNLSKVTIFVANRFKLDWVRTQYSSRISNMLEKFSGQPVSLELALAPKEAPVRPVLAIQSSDVLPPEDPLGSSLDPGAGNLK
eukprot:gene42127-55935_t